MGYRTIRCSELDWATQRFLFLPASAPANSRCHTPPTASLTRRPSSPPGHQQQLDGIIHIICITLHYIALYYTACIQTHIHAHSHPENLLRLFLPYFTCRVDSSSNHFEITKITLKIANLCSFHRVLFQQWPRLIIPKNIEKVAMHMNPTQAHDPFWVCLFFFFQKEAHVGFTHQFAGHTWIRPCLGIMRWATVDFSERKRHIKHWHINSFCRSSSPDLSQGQTGLSLGQTGLPL